MKKYLFFILFFILLSACSKEEKPVIEKEVSPAKGQDEQPVLVEKQDEEKQKKEMSITFPLEDEQIIINLEMVPILEEYLAAVPNRKEEIKRMKLERMDIVDKSTIYLLEFACQNDKCSYILFDQSNDDSAYLVADLAKLNKILVSPDESKLALQFRRQINKENDVYTDKLIGVNLEDWGVVSFVSDTDEIDLNYKWPIIFSTWKDNNTLLVEIPDLIEPSIESLKQWKNMDKKTKSINLKVKTEQ
ncbi:hypothetical protein NC797_04590 [Aquibacillus sp. 3ASR75-11]|uniref:Lipoprotein n=1 Tax=Terrihalobacillus insolitus TaxID=2950438 RepID=A0A9X3WT65_9BACI|nr:hypothetical protein [Terrihalobacillus insolitus]MDC3412737.1 hypothetical protein [Terrihalobacillus insolitus]MDC3423786.1 hypothetical protein [Terrihalobacillus insolitus]